MEANPWKENASEKKGSQNMPETIPTSKKKHSF